MRSKLLAGQSNWGFGWRGIRESGRCRRRVTLSTVRRWQEVCNEDICAGQGSIAAASITSSRRRRPLGLAVPDVNWARTRAVLNEAFQAKVEPLARIGLFVDGFGPDTGADAPEDGYNARLPAG